MGDMTTWILTVAVGLAAVIAVIMAVNRLFGSFRTIKEEFYCPWVERSVKVAYLTIDGKRPVGVMSCSAFADTTGVLCGTPCLAGGGRAGATSQRKDALDC